MSNLNVSERNGNIANSAKKCRREGKVPGIFYGRDVQNFMFEISELELNREISCVGEHGILSFNIGSEEKTALVKEIQRDPVTHKIVHIDINEIEKGNKIQTEVPIQYIGEEILATHGIVLQKERDSVKVSCETDKLPKNIKIDISNSFPGDIFKYSDLECGEEISIIDDLNTVIAAVSNQKKIVSAVDAENNKNDKK